MCMKRREKRIIIENVTVAGCYLLLVFATYIDRSDEVKPPSLGTRGAAILILP